MLVDLWREIFPPLSFPIECLFLNLQIFPITTLQEVLIPISIPALRFSSHSSFKNCVKYKCGQIGMNPFIRCHLAIFLSLFKVVRYCYVVISLCMVSRYKLIPFSIPPNSFLACQIGNRYIAILEFKQFLYRAVILACEPF